MATRLAPWLAALTLGLALGCAGPASATDLLQAWQAAQTHDPELASAHQDLLAGQARADQADSLWRPTVEARAAVGRATQENQTRGARFSAPAFGTQDGADFETSVRNGSQLEYGIQLRQPLIDPGRTAQARQLRHSAAQAEAAWTVARQQAVLRLARRYFDVLLSARRHAVLLAQRQAVERMLGQARARYRAGDASILDTHEAQARLGQIDTQTQLSATQLELARTAFTQLTGLPADGLAPLRENDSSLTARPEKPLSDWLAVVDQASPELRRMLEGAAMAAEQAEALRAVAQPSLGLIGAAGRTRLSGSGLYGDSSYTANQWSVGLELRIPLYTGGMRSARYQEALAQRDGARFQAASARQRLALLTQATWLSLDTGPARVQALRQALQASAARRQATRLGVEVGDRTLLDQLDAEQDYARTELDLAQALIELAIDRLQLQSLAGTLNQEVLASVNCLLQGEACR